MKTIKKFCSVKNYKYVKITYNTNGMKLKRKGFDIFDNDNKILFSFEPVNYSNGDKWILRHGKSKDNQRYFKRITTKTLFNLIPAEFPFILIK